MPPPSRRKSMSPPQIPFSPCICAWCPQNPCSASPSAHAFSCISSWSGTHAPLWEKSQSAPSGTTTKSPLPGYTMEISHGYRPEEAAPCTGLLPPQADRPDVHRRERENKFLSHSVDRPARRVPPSCALRRMLPAQLCVSTVCAISGSQTCPRRRSVHSFRPPSMRQTGSRPPKEA